MAVDMVGVMRIVGCPTELSVAIPMGGDLEMRRVEGRFRDCSIDQLFGR